MAKKIILVFLLVSVLAQGLALASSADSWIDGGNNALRPLQMVSIKTVYGGVSGVPNGNYNDITGYSGGVDFTPNRVGASGYTSSALKVEINSNPTTSVDATAYYFDFVITFPSADFDEFEVSMRFQTPRHYNSNGVSGGNDTFDLTSSVRCYFEEYYNSSSRQYFESNSNTSITLNYKGSAYKLHVHLSCNSASSLGLYYSSIGLASVSLLKVNMTKINPEDKVQQEAEDFTNNNSSDDITNSSSEAGSIENSIQRTQVAFSSLASSMSSTSTSVGAWKFPKMYIPATSVTPRINLTNQEIDINFNQWIDSIPSSVLSIVQYSLSCALYIFCGYEVISIISFLLNNRDGIGNVLEQNEPNKR